MSVRLAPALLALACAAAAASPDEALLGRAAGYPAAPRLSHIHDPGFIVGSFSAMEDRKSVV